jgi:hypothetical protein
MGRSEAKEERERDRLKTRRKSLPYGSWGKTFT